MSACPQCGYAARPNDRFCNACGSLLVLASSPPTPAPAAPYAAPDPSPFLPPMADPYGGGYGGAPQNPYVSPRPSPQPPPQPAFGGPPGALAYGLSEPAREAVVPPNALRGFLVAFGANPSGDFWPLTGGRLTVGRFGSADRLDIALQDPTISSRHAAILVDAAGATITVEDTGSTNGTFVNEEHIGFNGRRDLRDGDRVRFGAYATIVKVIGRV